jgi:hypothetical protein
VGATPVGSKKIAPDAEDANARKPLIPADTGTEVD